jgi:hypothetical protein
VVVDNPLVHKVVDNLAARKVELDIVVAVAHKVGPDIVIVAARKVEPGTVPGAGYMSGMDIGTETARIETDIAVEAGYTVVIDIVGRVLMVVDMVFVDWYIGPIPLVCTRVGRMDPCLLMYCHSHHKIARLLRCVFRNFRTLLLQLVVLHVHAHHDHTGYKTWCLLEYGLDTQDTQSCQDMMLAWLDLAVSAISARYHNAYKRSHPDLLLHDSWGRQSDSDYLPPGLH